MSIRHSVSAVLAGALAACTLSIASHAVAQPRCDAPRVLVVLDRSSSMSASRGGTLAGGLSKWQAARQAVGEMTTAFADGVDFGLAIYPAVDRLNACTPGAVTLDVAPHASEEVLAAIPEVDPPHGGNFTPTSQTLDVVSSYAPLLDPTRDSHVVLVTDGEQCCIASGTSHCIAAQRFWPVESVMALRASGVRVHVVGFGAHVDPLALNRMALAGGTSLPGCDPDGEDAASPDHCYVQANDLTELRAALSDIARSVTDEACDGFDNDCDGEVDEGFDQDTDGFTICGSDPTVPGTPLDRGLEDCADTDAAIHPGAREVCNGLDDDCDGTVDPGCDCLLGETRPCGSDTGVCALGVQTCVDSDWGAAWGECAGETGPVPETCDGRDDDCDGEADDGALCDPGHACVSGACVELVPPVQDGACCSVAVGSAPASGGAGVAAGLSVLALALARRRRR